MVLEKLTWLFGLLGSPFPCGNQVKISFVSLLRLVSGVSSWSIIFGKPVSKIVMSPVFPYISLSQYTPVSSWSNRPLLSGGDSSCSWVLCSCTGPKGESYTLQKGWQSVSPVAIMPIWNRVHSGGYSHERTQTSSFSCKVY